MKDRRALVTGGAKGIGLAVARRLAAGGARLALLGRDADALARAQAELGADIAVADVTDAAALTAAIARLGAFDILVNNAGGVITNPFARQGLDQWEVLFRLNTLSVVAATQAVLPAMRAQGWGRIVSIASTAAVKGYAYCSAYCATKAAVLGLTRALAIELAGSGVTAGTVCPGFTDTDMVARGIAAAAARGARGEAEARAGFAASNPESRLIRPEEVAEAVAFLCGEAGAAMNGQSIIVAAGEIMP